MDNEKNQNLLDIFMSRQTRTNENEIQLEAVNAKLKEVYGTYQEGSPIVQDRHARAIEIAETYLHCLWQGMALKTALKGSPPSFGQVVYNSDWYHDALTRMQVMVAKGIDQDRGRFLTPKDSQVRFTEMFDGVIRNVNNAMGLEDPKGFTLNNLLSSPG